MFVRSILFGWFPAPSQNISCLSVGLGCAYIKAQMKAAGKEQNWFSDLLFMHFFSRVQNLASATVLLSGFVNMMGNNKGMVSPLGTHTNIPRVVLQSFLPLKHSEDIFSIPGYCLLTHLD